MVKCALKVPRSSATLSRIHSQNCRFLNMNRRRSKEATSQTWLPTTQQSHPFSAPDHPSRGAATTRKRKPQTTDSDNRGALPRLVVGNSAPTSSWDIRDRLQKVTSAREIPTPPRHFASGGPGGPAGAERVWCVAASDCRATMQGSVPFFWRNASRCARLT